MSGVNFVVEVVVEYIWNRMSEKGLGKKQRIQVLKKIVVYCQAKLKELEAEAAGSK